MSMIRTLAAAALLAGTALSVPAMARDLETSYPRTVGNGNNIEVIYGPGAQANNVVGGGAVSQARQLNGDTRALYLGDAASQQPRAGLVPVTVGSGESAQIFWVPANEASQASSGGVAPRDAVQG